MTQSEKDNGTHLPLGGVVFLLFSKKGENNGIKRWPLFKPFPLFSTAVGVIAVQFISNTYTIQRLRRFLLRLWNEKCLLP
jgi:hypothetical protein